MRRGGLSSAGLSVLFALGLALWEVYFFWLVPSLDGTDGLFTPERLGFNHGMARRDLSDCQLNSHHRSGRAAWRRGPRGQPHFCLAAEPL